MNTIYSNVNFHYSTVRFGLPVGGNILEGTGTSDAGLCSPPSPTIKFIWGRHLKVAIRVGCIVIIRRLSFGPTIRDEVH